MRCGLRTTSCFSAQFGMANGYIFEDHREEVVRSGLFFADQFITHVESDRCAVRIHNNVASGSYMQGGTFRVHSIFFPPAAHRAPQQIFHVELLMRMVALSGTSGSRAGSAFYQELNRHPSRGFLPDRARANPGTIVAGT